jgi:adenosine deaminase
VTVQPLAQVNVDPLIASLPKADLHIHQESKARLEHIAAKRQGRLPYDRQNWARQLLNESPPGLGRLDGVYEPDYTLNLGEVEDSDPEHFVTRVADVLEEAASDGAVLVEIRFGADDLLSRPDFMALFREAEHRAKRRYPRLRAEATGFLNPVDDPVALYREEQRLEACLRAAREGLVGVDFRVDPYDKPAGQAIWAIAHTWAKRATDSGLGITIHAGEFSTANLEAALEMPGLKRLGHGVYAAYDERLLERLAASGATIECSLTCNVILGAVPSYEAHPIRRFVEYGIPVTLSTDLPVHVCTTIGREYAIASELGFSPAELLWFTRNAIQASFTSTERRTALMEEVRLWEAGLLVQ